MFCCLSKGDHSNVTNINAMSPGKSAKEREISSLMSRQANAFSQAWDMLAAWAGPKFGGAFCQIWVNISCHLHISLVVQNDMSTSLRITFPPPSPKSVGNLAEDGSAKQLHNTKGLFLFCREWLGWKLQQGQFLIQPALNQVLLGKNSHARPGSGRKVLSKDAGLAVGVVWGSSCSPKLYWIYHSLP